MSTRTRQIETLGDRQRTGRAFGSLEGMPRGGMHLFEGMVVAFTSLHANKLRALLTMLGIIIGTGAVITMIALGSGARKAVEERISQLGADLLFVRAGASRGGPVHMGEGSSVRLTEKDTQAIATECPSVLAVAPELNGSAQAKFGNNNWNTRILGTYPEYEWLRNSPTKYGKYFTHADDNVRRRVCLLGPTVAENLFGKDVNPVGQTIKIRNINFEVLGLLQEKGSEGWRNSDDQIIIPLRTMQKRITGQDNVSSIDVRAVNQAAMDRATIEIESLLRRRHKLQTGQENDFNIMSMTDVTSTLGETTETFTMLLASIALVSLIVGGIGIMNIMLVSVTERTREIGVRKAVGGRSRDILLQFLIESITLAIGGGILGIAAGVGGAYALAYFAGWNTLISPTAVALAFGFSFAVGVFFGFYPARKASRLDPIEALRYE
jgi:ABC-type antimicrobial peptide transport system permease subunit